MKYEYTIYTLGLENETEMKTILNNYGNDGWELINLVKKSSGHYFIFKRPK